MRIALFGTISGMGGIERHTRLMAKMLLNAGAEVMVISSVMSKTSAIERWLIENEPLKRGGARILWVPELPTMGRRLREVFRIAREVRRFRPDILVGTQTSYHLGLLGVLLPRKVRKIFFEVMSGESNGANDPRWLVRWFFDEVVGQSPRVAQNFKRSFGWKMEVSAIPAFPEPLELTAKLPQIKRHAVPLGMARAALFSRLVEGKQALWLVRQWAALKDLVGVLHIHGLGPEQPAIEAFIAEHGLQDRVRCCGAYPGGQAYADLLAGYDLTLLPTVFPEGAPLVLLESMACGVPFVANGMGGIPDYAIDNPDCIVVPAQPAFIEGVRMMLEALSHGTIDQGRLQLFYLKRFSHASIEKNWLTYLGVLQS
jgi:glycosyltransferase involved in cell wall biosynthesis